MATKSKHPEQRLKYLGNVIKIPADKVNSVLSGDINKIILPEGTDFSFNNIYAYKQGSKSSEQHIGVFAVIARYPLYIATSRTVFVDRLNIFGAGKSNFIRSVGFTSFDEFVNYYAEKYQLPFEGKIIEWKVNGKQRPKGY